jgi:flagellar biosynthesis repressor protein FlbT
MALRLTLKPGERVIVGGAVVRMGRSRGELFVDSQTPVLREADVLSPAAVRTPCQRIVLALQLVYIEPERVSHHLALYRTLAEQVRGAAPSTGPLLDAVDRHLETGRHYQALKSARALLDYERELISHVR